MFGLVSIKENPVPLYESGYFSTGMETLLEEAIKVVMELLRP